MSDLKRKWQIALRRYIIEGRPAVEYAPYFGINFKGFRKWIELSFDPSMNWGNFGKAWQLDHIVPVSFFDLDNEKDLCLCWNFINIKPAVRESGEILVFDSSKAVAFFENLFIHSGYYMAQEMVNRIKGGKLYELPDISEQVSFLKENSAFLNQIEGLSSIEMELINKGMGLKEAIIEAENIRRLSAI